MRPGWTGWDSGWKSPTAFARRVAEQLDPRAIAETTIGPLASAETREAIDRAESKTQAMAMLLMAPEFLRR